MQEHLAMMADDELHESQEINAELLAALEWAHAQLCKHPDWCEANHPTMKVHHDALRTAIAKARSASCQD